MNEMAISALRNPDWLTIRLQPDEVAAASLAAILRNLDRIEEQAFAVRGEAMLLIEERNLYRWIVDEEVGDYYVSFDKFLKDLLPRSWGYCRDALRTRKECRQIPYGDFVNIKRCNLEQLKKTSSNVRTLPDVIQAAKQLPEKAFVAKLNAEHSQALEVKQPVVMASKDDCAEFEAAIARSMELGATTRAEAIRDISVNYLLDHPLEDAEATA
jgi:hypothetical protein